MISKHKSENLKTKFNFSMSVGVDSRDKALKCKTWALVRDLYLDSPYPIVLGGDFNEILGHHEKTGGVMREQRVIDSFREVLDECGLRDLGYERSWVTWERGTPAGEVVREILDRFVGCTRWCAWFSEANVTHLTKFKFDHVAILLDTDSKERKKKKNMKKRFRFETCWLLAEGIEDVIRDSWSGASHLDMSNKLLSVANDLTRWSKDSFDDLGEKISEAEDALKEAQLRSNSQSNFDECNKLEAMLDDLHEKNEAYWFLRSSVSEIRDGDRNTKYFHHKASQRKSKNRIRGLMDSNGDWRTGKHDVEKIILDFYGSLFTGGEIDDNLLNEVLANVPSLVSEGMNLSLSRPYLKDEIFAALSQMSPCKAPDPGGLHAIFYQKYWHIVGDDVTLFVNNIISGRVSMSHVNRTNVALIPKVRDPTSIAQFRPISLCNVLYKLASKSVANRLKPLLHGMVTENQSAFVPKRLITNNALIALELFHTMKKRSKGRRGSIAKKLDMSKAYDRVEWEFLRRLLTKLGFAGAWVDTIMTFVSTVSYSFNINGVPLNDLIPSRGLRQGDPISPYLFILVSDVLSRMLQLASERKLIHGVRASRNGPEITHLFFADDILLFTRATRQECSVIVDILNKYEATSGQKINLEKSEVSFSKGVPLPSRITLSSVLGMKMVESHVKYLGLPTKIGRSKKAVFAFVKDRIWKKVQGWKEKLLSRPGKEVLLKSVIQAIPTYLMGVYRFLSNLINEIHSMMARFWWGSNEKGRKIHWKSWDALCQLKFLGGMGFRDLGIFNVALLGKQIWRLATNDHSLVSRVLKAKYYPKMSIFEAALAIPISGRLPNDSITWAWSKDGYYEVKSAYLLGSSLNLDDFDKFWVEIWNVKTTPKVRHFLWRCCSNSLPTRSLLKHRHLIEDPLCPCCNLADETTVHAIILCPSAHQLWLNSGCREALNLANSDSFGEILLKWAEHLSKEVYQRSLFLSWFIWFRRNKWVFENAWDADEALLLRHSRLVVDYGEYTEKIYGGTSPPNEPAGRTTWMPPPSSVVKINVDASISDEGCVGLGVIARDSRGRVLFSIVSRVRARWEPLIAESKAALFGLRKVRDQGYNDVILEADCLQLVSKIKKNTFSLASVDCVLEDIIAVSSNFSSIFWSHVKREGNFVAHHLAKLVSYGREQLWEFLVPDEISPYVLLDTLSLN
ncbi:uncharacterized protein LOC110715453 [Chenopodium quinoa]|uniref:uncharacterized protein LOC110715453 n=1 Tax=Chenopodium quinoa TaxID=63459 RepID=UPI000B76E47C|nr:uncharacterized protein LOC110715453 [Chenopodium quinoa]